MERKGYRYDPVRLRLLESSKTREELKEAKEEKKNGKSEQKKERRRIFQVFFFRFVVTGRLINVIEIKDETRPRKGLACPNEMKETGIKDQEDEVGRNVRLVYREQERILIEVES